MAKFEKGVSGNKRGRPKGSLNKNTPQQILVKALSNGADLKDLKGLGLSLIDPKGGKLSDAQVVNVWKTLVDAELKLIELGLKYEPSTEKDITPDDDEDDSAVFSLKSV